MQGTVWREQDTWKARACAAFAQRLRSADAHSSLIANVHARGKVRSRYAGASTMALPVTASIKRECQSGQRGSSDPQQRGHAQPRVVGGHNVQAVPAERGDPKLGQMQ